MLIDVETRTDSLLSMVAMLNNHRVDTQRIAQGMYLIGHWNFDSITHVKMNAYPDLPDDMSCYGVCDTPLQVVDKALWLIASPTKYVVSFVKISKSEQPAGNGWRWHKWGEYIGDQQPQCEYIADEPTIDEVYTYHIYEILEG